MTAKKKAKKKGLESIDVAKAPPLLTPDGVNVICFDGQVFRPVDVDHVTLGEYLRRLRDLDDQVKAARKVVVAEVLQRMDHKASWTMPFGPGKLTAPSPRTSPDYDGELLHANLQQLVKDGAIDEEAALAACKEDVKWKPMKGGIKKLAALGNEDIDRQLGLAEKPDDRSRSVRVELDPNHPDVR